MNRADALAVYNAANNKYDETQERLIAVRRQQQELEREFQKTEADISAMQSARQSVSTILQILPNDHFIVKTYRDRYVVGAREAIPRSRLTVGSRVACDTVTRTIMRVLPTEVDAKIFNMLAEHEGPEPEQKAQWSDIGGLNEQIYQIREIIELPLTQPELFKRVGVKAPKGLLLYGPPGTGKTLIARTLAQNVNATFIKIVASSIDAKYIGESSKIVRDMFAYAREHAPAIIFIDEIDAIGGRRLNDSSANDREVQRTMMQLLNEMDGFDELTGVKVIMATNRPDILDPALLRPGRLDRKVEIPLPNEDARRDILRIHTRKMNLAEDVDFEPVIRLAAGFNGADMRNIATEAGMNAIRAERGIITNDDLVRATRKLADAKRVESKIEYAKV